MTPPSLSWPVSDAMQGKLRYTGFVAPPPAIPHPDRLGAGEIIVSAGGGDVGAHVFDTCRAAAARSCLWHPVLNGLRHGGHSTCGRFDHMHRRRTRPAGRESWV